MIEKGMHLVHCSPQNLNQNTFTPLRSLKNAKKRKKGKDFTQFYKCSDVDGFHLKQELFHRKGKVYEHSFHWTISHLLKKKVKHYSDEWVHLIEKVFLYFKRTERMKPRDNLCGCESLKIILWSAVHMKNTSWSTS